MLPELLLNVHRIHDWCTEYLAKNQRSFLLKGPWFANMDMFFTVDPANAHYILRKNLSNFPKGPEFKEIFDPLGDGIFNSDSDSWKSQKKFAQAMMNHHSFYKFLLKTSQDKVENGLIPVLKYVREQGITVDLQDVFQRFTFDSTCLLVTGYDPGCLSPDFPEVSFCRSLEEGEEAVFYRHVVPESVWKLQGWLGIGQERKLKKAREIVDRVLFDYIQRKRTEMKKENLQNLQKQEVEGVDLLTSYMDENKAMAANLKSEDDNFLRDSILNFMLAGRDTRSSALTWFFWLLSNPKAETRIREELKSIIPGENFGKWYQFDIQELGNLVYLHGAFCEALRLFPPVPFQHKSPLAPDVLPTATGSSQRRRSCFLCMQWGE
ncbi:Cytochrome P450 [Melia azedarach]|uniref:Cytochrome P450 n=1 Tax=Melia azedarach TaxID=155640 RepID=A0ACC1XVR1_MELAZ|nr:Cytochrome P450 [Melia azedarach]